MKILENLKFIFTAFTLILFVACSSDDDNSTTEEEEEEVVDETTVTLTGEITEDTTWSADTIYVLDGKVIVGEGVTLTIEPGTIIKGEEGTGSLASALIVQRDASIYAVGTEDDPIIFTSILDDVTIGDYIGTLSTDEAGLWGGLIVLGNAPVSLEGDATEQQIEGISASDTYGLYGGDDSADNSGTLSYISIRHGGADLGTDNEINGLTLGGVGSATSVSNIEIVSNDDDGIEIFGGAVNVSNILVYLGHDDGIDLDQAYTGTISNSVVAQGVNSDSALELDGPEGTLEGTFTLDGITLIGNNDDDESANNRRMADFRSGLLANLNNVYVTGFPSSSTVRLNGDDSATNYNNEELTLSSWEIVLPSDITEVTEIFATTGLEEVTTTFVDDSTGFATAIEAGAATVGADTSVFAWTYANTQGGLGF
ncbi:hypothetical protein KO500_02230 [Cellulophaga baltica]|uniref:hypothetical protein n=1 Tax=Cellulophaga TaxID=104264 RepID=UPI001C067E91|nr:MULTISPECIES: hypothetical protein [Cellulophaga]MBU2995228.1 hypothetical protein [Cellulophaga baltica]MDO6766623.1 hypothetical protein [Cellulophaga sp. 1_MG-2023]